MSSFISYAKNGCPKSHYYGQQEQTSTGVCNVRNEGGTQVLAQEINKNYIPGNKDKNPDLDWHCGYAYEARYTETRIFGYNPQKSCIGEYNTRNRQAINGAKQTVPSKCTYTKPGGND